MNWPSLAAILDDPEVELQGYQPSITPSHSGLVLFRHNRCGTTMALDLPSLETCATARAAKLPPGEVKAPPTICLGMQEGLPCPPDCVCGTVASILEGVQGWPKKAAPPPPTPSQPPPPQGQTSPGKDGAEANGG